MKNKKRGLFFVITGGILWGASGTSAEYLFSGLHVSPNWLVGIRLFSAGLLLLIWYGMTAGKSVFDIWKKKSSWIMLILFAFLGVLPSQWTYFLAINYGNAPTATVLQFLGPLFIIVYLTVANRELPRRTDVISVILALIGTFLLVTNGNLNGLVLSPLALFWGVMSGIASATYTLLPRGLLTKYDARSVVGWAMLISSFSFIGEVTNKPLPKLNLMGILCILFIIIFGTMFAYLFYLSSLRDLSPSTTSMLSSFEPLTATVLSVTLLSTPFTLVQLIGGILILSTTFLQALPTKTIEHSEASEEAEIDDSEISASGHKH